MGNRRKGLLLTLASTLLLAGGCDDGRDARAPVSGRITCAGEPVVEGMVTFYPADGRRQAIGVLGDDGAYTLTTFDKGDGAFLGKHVVVIDAVRSVDTGPASLQEETEATFASGPQIERLVPERYADLKSSPLQADVQDQRNTIDFDIPR